MVSLSSSSEASSFAVEPSVTCLTNVVRVSPLTWVARHAHPTFLHTTPDSFTEAVQKVCVVDERAAVTEKFVEYLAYKATYENVNPNEEIPDFQERIAPEIALELLSAADYLEA